MKQQLSRGAPGALLALVVLLGAGDLRAQATIFGLQEFSAVVAVTPPIDASASAVGADDEEFVDEYATAVPRVSDPFEGFNRTMFKFNDRVYAHVLRPVARSYETVVPEPARRGVRNFFDNLRYPVRLVSCALQGKFDRAGAETGKFLLNSTVGLGGFIKVSDRFVVLRVPEEDIGQALGHWGIGHGPFLVLPIFGPSSVRDLAGDVGDACLTPINWRFLDRHDWPWRAGLRTADIVSGLPGLTDTYDSLRRAAVDPYIAFRNAYIEYRNAAVAK